MLFKDYHIPMIREGEKTVTRREWAQNYAGPSIGTVVAATTEMFVPDDEADCYIEITNRYPQPLGAMTDKDAQKEGDYNDLDEFREGYEQVYGEGSWDPEKVVEVVEFEYVGRTRPTEQETLVTDGGRDEFDAGVYRIECPACADQWEYGTQMEGVARKVDAALHWQMNHDGKIPEDASFGEHQCPNCLDVLGLNGTVSCSECGFVPEGVRADAE